MIIHLEYAIKNLGVGKVHLVPCEHEECATAFHIDIRLKNDKFTFVIEVSKLGRWAKAYWKRVGLIGTRYIDTPPNEKHRRLYDDVNEILKAYELKLLSRDEPGLEIPGIPDRYNPDDSETVGNLLFYFDGRHS